MTDTTPSPAWQLPRAQGPATARATFRADPADFVVDERLEIPEHETGAHWWMQITKTGLNTRDVVRALAELTSSRVRQVGYAGLKDRHAVTTQWFSLPLERVDPETLVGAMPEGLELLGWKRARHAIRRGGLKANHFAIRLRDVQGEPEELEARLAAINAGVPNYFGEQRFGRKGENLHRARRLFDGRLGRVQRFERGMYLSAARSWLFNQVLAERVRQDSWNRLLPGEVVVLDGSRSRFCLEDPPSHLQDRLDRFDIHPSGPLPGIGEPLVSDECAALEAAVLATEPDLVAGLENWRLRAERRSLRLVPRKLAWRWEKEDLVLEFELPSGTFATTILNELAELIS